jgi:hypothetical protein
MEMTAAATLRFAAALGAPTSRSRDRYCDAAIDGGEMTWLVMNAGSSLRQACRLKLLLVPNCPPKCHRFASNNRLKFKRSYDIASLEVRRPSEIQGFSMLKDIREPFVLKRTSRFVLEVLPYLLSALIAAVVVPGFLYSKAHEPRAAANGPHLGMIHWDHAARSSDSDKRAGDKLAYR